MSLKKSTRTSTYLKSWKHKPLYFRHTTMAFTQKLTYQQLTQRIIVSLLWNVQHVSAAKEHQQVSTVNILSVFYSYQIITTAWVFWHSCMRECQYNYVWLSGNLCVNVIFMRQCQYIHTWMSVNLCVNISTFMHDCQYIYSWMSVYLCVNVSIFMRECQYIYA